MTEDGTTARFETISVTREDRTVLVELNRPDVHNAFNAELIAELTAAFRAMATDDTIRVIVVRGAGKSFCAGADVNWMRVSLDLTKEENTQDALRMSDMFAVINEAPQAVIGRVHGAALGGGMGLLAVCDIVVAADNVKFGFTETKLGIIPAVISRFVFPKIGPSWARRYFLTGERFGAEAAREIGLVHDIVDEDELDNTVDKHVKALQSAGPMAVEHAKDLVAGLQARPKEEYREFTAGRIAAVRTSPEGQEGLRAFLEKRAPAWMSEQEASP